jgi:hypothetical protein
MAASFQQYLKSTNGSKLRIDIQIPAEIDLKSGAVHIGIIACFKGIIDTEGFLALWRGNLANCFRAGPKTAFDMAFKEQLKIFFRYILVSPGSGFMMTFLAKFLAGVVATSLSTMICYPLDFIRTILALDTKK